MKKILFPVLLLFSTAAYPHGGGIDGQGGPNDRVDEAVVVHGDPS